MGGERVGERKFLCRGGQNRRWIGPNGPGSSAVQTISKPLSNLFGITLSFPDLCQLKHWCRSKKPHRVAFYTFYTPIEVAFYTF